MIFKDTWLNRIILLVYLWLPYTIFWSRACMIDYLSVALSLAYLYFFLRWLNRKQMVASIILTIIFGTLAYLTKLTTVPAYVMVAGCMALVHIIKNHNKAKWKSWLVQRMEGYTFFRLEVNCSVQSTSATGSLA